MKNDNKNKKQIEKEEISDRKLNQKCNSLKNKQNDINSKGKNKKRK